MISKRSILKPVFIALAALPLLSACGPNIPETLTIGVAQPLSGTSAARGQDLLNGVKMAVDEINISGLKIGGKLVKLEVVSADDKGDVAVAKTIAQDFVDRKFYAVVGHLSSDITETVIPIYKQGDVVQLFTSSAAHLATLGEGNTFRLVANDLLQAKAIASYVGETLKASKIAIIHEDSAFGTPMKNDVVTELTKQKRKAEVIETVNNKVSDFAPFIAKLKASTPDTLIAVLRDHQLIALFQQMKAAGLSDVPVMATSVGKTAKMVNAPADVKTLYLTSSSLEPREFSAGPAFADKFRLTYKSDPVWAAHYAYDAVHVLTHTLRSIGTVDKVALREKLHSIDAIAPVTGTMRFNAAGEQLFGAISVYHKRDGVWDPLVRSDQW